MQTPSDGKSFVRVPWPRFIGMAAFLMSLILAIFVSAGEGPWGIDWATFYVGWLGYVILIATSFIFIYNHNKKDEEEKSR